MNKSVAVLGRGIAGLSVAWRLAQRGCRVTVYGSPLSHRRASSSAIGVFTNKGLFSARTLGFKLKLDAHFHLPAWIRELTRESETDIAHSWDGVYELFSNIDEYRYLKERIWHGSFQGCFGNQELSKRQMVERFAFLSIAKAEGAWFFPNDGWLDVDGVLFALEKVLAETHSVVFEPWEVPPEQVVVGSDGDWKIGSSSQFDELVVASGSGAPAFLDLTQSKCLKMKQVPGWLLTGSTSFSGHFAVKDRLLSLLLAGNKLRYGSADVGDLLRWPSLFEEKLGRKFLGILDHQSVAMQKGVRLRVQDRLPVVGPGFLYGKKAWFFCAFYKSGFLLADFLAPTLCQSIVTGRCQDFGVVDSRRLIS